MLRLFARSLLQYRVLVYGIALAVIAWSWSHDLGRVVVRAQEKKKAVDEVGPVADAPPAVANDDSEQPAPANAPAKDEGINILALAAEGGIFMWPLYALSILAVTIMVERSIALRREKIIPKALETALGQLGQSKGGFDPRRAYRICQEHPSPTSNVIRAMLLKVGRPHSEVEHTVKEAADREANRIYANIRWLNLSTAVAPLIGLLGTVQGMIIAFHQMTTLGASQNKAVALAGGIYTALVTTFAGLCVAIPAAMAAHYFEGKITELFHDVDELLFNLLPQIERYEGRIRFSRQSGETEFATDTSDEAPAPPVQPRTPAVTPK